MQRCLEKKPERRFQSASDLAFALEALSDFTRSTAAAVEQTAVEQAAAGRAEASPENMEVGGCRHYFFSRSCRKRDRLVKDAHRGSGVGVGDATDG